MVYSWFAAVNCTRPGSNKGDYTSEAAMEWVHQLSTSFFFFGISINLCTQHSRNEVGVQPQCRALCVSVQSYLHHVWHTNLPIVNWLFSCNNYFTNFLYWYFKIIIITSKTDCFLLFSNMQISIFYIEQLTASPYIVTIHSRFRMPLGRSLPGLGWRPVRGWLPIANLYNSRHYFV